MATKRVLIIDDELEVTRLLKVLLERKCAYEVRVENDSRHALDTAHSFRPDLVLLDIIMPHIDGGDVARQMRREPALECVPIVFMSACAEQIAGYPFLPKPTAIERLIEVIGQNIA